MAETPRHSHYILRQQSKGQHTVLQIRQLVCRLVRTKVAPVGLWLLPDRLHTMYHYDALHMTESAGQTVQQILEKGWMKQQLLGLVGTLTTECLADSCRASTHRTISSMLRPTEAG